ncbi:MAG: P-type conjugative transfer ATPase TrbB [Candidatus Binatus sp.]|uniref:P-type conjugative transfer ATPase TrbB n=1 Tax=Candidatus Binatus sp. TaxID=2811406 RepID=UPI003BB204DD
MTPRDVQTARLSEKLRRELGPVVLKALSDPDVIEIILNPDGRIWVESHTAGMSQTDASMAPTQAENLIGTVAAALNAVANPQNPIIEGELPLTGSRFEGLLPPIAPSPCFVIRKRASVLYTLDHYIKDNIVTRAQAIVLRDAIAKRRNIVIAGGTGSGKTTLVNALIHEMVSLGDQAERFVIIEDTLELQCAARNALQLHTTDAADMTRLVRATMRLRPDRIIIGEVRGKEALALLKAWNTGHPGGITTLHANSASAALLRLLSLVEEAGVPAQPQLIAEAVNLLAFMERTSITGRRLTELVHVEGYSQNAGFKFASAI